MNRIAAALLLLLVPCGPKRTVLINGQTVPYEEAAGEEFRKAKSQFDQGHFDEAAEGFRRFLQKFPESELSDEALYRRGQALSRAGKQVEAQSVLQMLLEQRPKSPFKKAAALELGLVQSKLGVKQDSESLRPMVADMSDKERQQAAASLFEAYTKSGQAGEAARWAAKAVEASPEGPEREARLKDLDTALESAPAPDVAQLVADLSRSSPAWPAAALKLARIQLHTGDRTHAAELAAQILSTTGGTGPYADGARAVQRSVQASAMIKPNLVGIVLPLSGDLKGFADQALNAIALTLDLQGRGKIQVEVKDTKGEPDVAADAVEELAQKGAIAILGPLGVAEGLAAATRAQQLGIPIVSLSRAEGRTPDDLSERQEFADEAKKIADQIKDTYKRRKALALLKNQQAPIVDFDALFIPDAARTVRLVAPAVASEDVITAGCDVKELEVVKKTTRNEQLRTVQLLGTSLWDSPDLVDERSGVARYVQCSIFIDTFYPH